MVWMPRARPCGQTLLPSACQGCGMSEGAMRQPPMRCTTLACIALLGFALRVAQRTAGTETRTEWRALPLHCPRELSP
jgi:hypothetical protein